MTIRETLAEGIRLLNSPCDKAHIDTPALDAALLLSNALQIRREDLIIRCNALVADEDRKNFFNLIERRRAGECVAYILGYKEFHGLNFLVTPDVLVPRPDTETLVEAALDYIDSIPEVKANVKASEKKLSLLDLCAGSGALAISLKSERPFLDVTASDISKEALEIAERNAVRFGQSIRFILSDLFDNFPEKIDIIVSNPPYIPSEQLKTLSPEVRREPRLALDGGEDGLEIIRKIISRAPEHLAPGGVLLLEADPEQMSAIKTLLEERSFNGIIIFKDLAGMERVIAGSLSLS